MHFCCRSVDTQRKHTVCHISFIFGAHRMQAYSVLSAIVMCILRCTSVAAPLILNANTLRVTFLLYLAHAYAIIQCAKYKRNTLTSESVCVGRSYRNRTYTVGVRGPSATTTPSSIACVIIYQRVTICNRFFKREQKIIEQNIFFERNGVFLLQKCKI